MTSRPTLSEATARARDSLVSALRSAGDNSELVAQRARRLLQCKPHGADRDTWLGQVLPQSWHVEKAAAALAAKNGGSTNGAAQGSPPGGTAGATTHRRPDRRAHRRTR